MVDIFLYLGASDKATNPLIRGVKINSQGSRSPPEAYSPSSKTTGGVPMPSGGGTDDIRSVPAKPVRLTVFGKAYSVPYRRVNKRDVGARSGLFFLSFQG